jgi:hypothetical protein
MLDRLSSVSQRGSRYDQMARECGVIQEAIERIGQGLAPWPGNQPMPQSAAELRGAALGLTHLHRLHESQWRRLGSTLESMYNLTQRIRESLSEIRHSQSFSENSFERMALDRMVREADLLEQQQRNILKHIHSVVHGQAAQVRPVPATPAPAPVIEEMAEEENAPVWESVEPARGNRGAVSVRKNASSNHMFIQPNHIFENE